MYFSVFYVQQFHEHEVVYPVTVTVTFLNLKAWDTYSIQCESHGTCHFYNDFLVPVPSL